MTKMPINYCVNMTSHLNRLSLLNKHRIIMIIRNNQRKQNTYKNAITVIHKGT